ncbi:MAG TPA: M28 family peptidase [Kineosporiaceae bacterium]|nr:M28 family peptidase [Kineosporiaceae bacterium]
MPGQGDPTELAARFELAAEVDRVIADVAWLSESPRGRGHHPEAMERAEKYVYARLSEAGWNVRAAPFEQRWALGVSDAGGRPPLWRRIRLFRRVQGVNLLAELPGRAPDRCVLLVAHLDSVACSPGADDNASGVAALLECARLLAGLPEPPAVKLAVVDLEELGKLGSRALAKDAEFTGNVDAVICLESVGIFSEEPHTQRLGGLGLIFRDLARRVSANQHRGDFALVIHRRSSTAVAQAMVAAGAALRVPLPVLLARDPRSDGWRGLLATVFVPLLANFDRSDHAPFWNRGIPAVMLTTTAPFRNRHYHLEGDRPEELDYPRLTALAAMVSAAAATMITRAVPAADQ